MVAGLSESLFNEARPLWDKIVNHPFVVELYKGTLPIEKFKFYTIQDYNYLIGMMRTFSLIAAKSEPEVAAKALELAYADATVEMENYKRLLDKLGLSFEEVVRTTPAPTNTAYMNFLIATASLGSPLEGLVATLPCFWSYQYIAEVHKDLLEYNPNPLYREWASVYLSYEYKHIVEELKRLVDRLYEESKYEKLKALFITGSKYEYLFWDMAYKMEKWPI